MKTFDEKKKLDPTKNILYIQRQRRGPTEMVGGAQL